MNTSSAAPSLSDEPETIGAHTIRAHTILDTFVEHTRHNGARTALRVRGESGWGCIDWATYGHQVDVLASALIGLGINPGDRISILSSNRPEWHVADLAAMTIGAVTVPLYPTAAPAQIAYLLRQIIAQLGGRMVEAEVQRRNLAIQILE